MTKDDLIHEVADNTGVDLATARVVIEASMAATIKALSNGKCLYLRGFGTFAPKQLAEKTARNISKNVAITVPAHKVPSFKPSKAFKEKVCHPNT